MSSDRGWLGLPRVPPEERERALRDPGPSWREWLSGSFAKTYLGLGFLIADGIVIASFLGPPIAVVGLVASTAVALYLEYLVWQYLWYIPRTWTSEPLGSTAGPRSAPAEARDGRSLARRLLHPVRFGRWTDAAQRWKKGLDPVPRPGPDPREFL